MAARCFSCLFDFRRTAAVLIGAVLLAACSQASLFSRPTATPSLDNLSPITAGNIDRVTVVARRPITGWAKFCLRFSPGSRMLAFPLDDVPEPAVQLMQTVTGETLHTYSGLAGRIECLAFSPDGALLAAGSNWKMLKIWNVTNGQELKNLAFPDGVHALAFSEDGKRLAAGLRNGAVQFLDTDDWRVVGTLSGHSDLVRSVDFSADGSLLASGSFDGQVILWDPETGAEIRRLNGHEGSVWRAAISPNGQSLATASSDGTIRVWKTATGQEQLVFRDPKVLEWFDVDFSPDGKLLAGASRHRLVILAADDPQRYQSFDSPGSGVDSVTFSADGRLLATGGDGAVQLWGVR